VCRSWNSFRAPDLKMSLPLANVRLHASTGAALKPRERRLSFLDDAWAAMIDGAARPQRAQTTDRHRPPGRFYRPDRRERLLEGLRRSAADGICRRLDGAVMARVGTPARARRRKGPAV